MREIVHRKKASAAYKFNKSLGFILAVSFEVVVKNRYKADKDYRRYQARVAESPNDPHLQEKLEKTRVSHQ